MIPNLDKESCALDKKVQKTLNKNGKNQIDFQLRKEKILLSAKLRKFNHVNKQQERILLITDQSVYNILPPSILGNMLASLSTSFRIKRKIPLHKIYGVTISRFGFEFTIHVPDEYDYRYSSVDFRDKIVEVLCFAFCKLNQRKMPFYFKDDMVLIDYTTTKVDIQKKIKRMPMHEPQLMDPAGLKQTESQKPNVQLIYSKTLSKSGISTSKVSIEDFQVIKVLGRGAFGKVMLCEHKQTKEVVAIKSLNKEHLINKDQIVHTKTERELLIKIQHPFLVSLLYCFQTDQKVFFVMPFLRGGELFYHLKNQQRFPEKQVKFYAAQLTLALGYLHELGYVYRDIKPENILFNEDGYIALTDFGLAKKLQPKGKTHSFVGTPDYLAPEIIKIEGHDFMVDWWSLGIIIYELMIGIPPFYSENQQQMFNFIKDKDVRFPNSIAISPEAKDIVIQLLRKSPQQRIGSQNDSQDIKQHAWFRDIDFQQLYNKKIEAPFIPQLKDKFDVDNFDKEFTSENPYFSMVEGNQQLINQFNSEFEDMTFVQGIK